MDHKDGIVAQGSKINPAAMSVDEMVRALAAMGGRFATAEAVRSDIDAGAPVNPDGTMNLVHYAAWLAKEEAARGD